MRNFILATITDTFISKLKKPSDKPVEHFDDKLSCFGVRIGKKGNIVFLIDYQLTHFDIKSGSQKVKRYRKSFAEWNRANPITEMDILNAEMARELAEKYRRLAKRNIDPFGKAISKETSIETVSNLMDAYLSRYVEVHCRQNTIDGIKCRTKKHIQPYLGSVPLRHLTKAHIEEFFKECAIERPMDKNPKSKRKRGGKTNANQNLADLTAALNKAVDWGIIPFNPASGVKKFKLPHRQRYLNKEELKQLFYTMDSIEADAQWSFKYKDCCDAVKIALFTGCRKGELMATRWENIDLESTPAVWRKPFETTKQKNWEIIPLSPECVEVLKKRNLDNQQRETPSPFVFPMPGFPDKHMLDIKNAWRTIRDKAGIKDFTFHDLRHTFGSLMAINGESLYVIGKMMGHKDIKTTQIYAKLNTGALEDLANSMSAVVQAAVQPAVPANDNRDEPISSVK